MSGEIGIFKNNILAFRQGRIFATGTTAWKFQYVDRNDTRNDTSSAN